MTPERSNAAEPSLAAGDTPSRRVATPNQPRWYQRLAAWLAVSVGRAVVWTLRCRWTDVAGHLAESPASPAIYCLWHNRLAVVLPLYTNYVHPRHRTAGLAALVSASKDGALLAAILECFGIQPVRGSTSRRGPQALLELTTWAEKGYDLAITPDGPRGPAGVAQGGVMVLAQVTGLPIVPFSYHAHRKWRLKSWDCFQIPMPFSRCEMLIGSPLRVPREATDEQREQLRRRLEQELNELSRER